jgi:O-antigen/teichoic acid export membrane protein
VNTFAGMFLARLLASAIAILATPIYLNLVGLEAVAAINLFSALQAVVFVADFGFSALATRLITQSELKTEKPHRDEYIHRMYIFQIKIVFVIALLASVLAYFLLGQWDWVWNSWGGIDGRLIASILGGVQLALMLRWNFGLAIMTAFSRYENLVVAVMLGSAVRIIVCAALLWHQPLLELYFLAQFLVTVCLVTWIGRKSEKLIVVTSGSLTTIRKVYGDYGAFMWNNAAIAGISVILLNLDKFMLARLVSAGEFAVYTVSATLAASVSLVVATFFGTYSARYAAALSKEKTQQDAASTVVDSAQLMNTVVMCIATPLIFWAYPVANLWVGDVALANQLAAIIPILALGYVINGVLNVPYMLHLASGDAKTPLLINCIAIVLMLPAVYFSVQLGGIENVAWCWLVLNILFLCFWPALVFKPLLNISAWVWFFRSVFFPMSVIFVTGFLLRLLILEPDGQVQQVLQLSALFSVLCVVAATSVPSLRRATLNQVTRLYTRV